MKAIVSRSFLPIVALLSIGVSLCHLLLPPMVEAAENKTAAFYSIDHVQTVKLTIADDDRARMLAALPERIYVPGTFAWENEVIENVGIRFKGNSSSQPNQRHKRSYLVKFNEYDKEKRFLDLRRVALDNAIQFGGLYSEILITEILRDLNLPASRSNYARVFLNGAFQGVHVNVERIDESFLETHLEGANGYLFKGEGGPGVDLAFHGPDLDLYKRGFEPKSKAAKSGYVKLAEFLKAVGRGPSLTNPSSLEASLTLDPFLQTMAVMLFAGAFDQATGWGPHNYYLYRPAGDGPWRYLPWDLDVGFADNAFGRVRVVDHWHAAWPIAGGGPPRPLLETIVSDSNLLSRYRALADEILEKYFRPERLHQRIEALQRLIQADLAQDPFPPGRATVPSDQSHEDVVTSIKEFMERRYQLARQQLDEPGSRPDYTRFELRQAEERRRQAERGSDGPRPGNRDGTPTELKIVERLGNTVRLRWQNHAPNAAMHVVQRAEGMTGEFRNHVGDHKPGLEELADPHARPDLIYRYRVYAVFPTPAGPQGTKPSEVVVSKPVVP